MLKLLILFLFSLNALAYADFTPNQTHVLLQLEGENHLLSQLETLQPQHLLHSLNQISGEQYTSLAVASELAGIQFLRSLYNPVRLDVITTPCPLTCCYIPSMEIWSQGGCGQSFINNCKHANHTVADHYTISLGAQTRIQRWWTIGAAASFAKNCLDYRDDGRGTNRFGFAALYGLYRPIGHYVMVDLIYGTQKGRLKRTVSIDDLHYFSFGNSKNHQFLGYIEAGLDHPVWNLLVQPFLGLEVQVFFNKKIAENGHSPFLLEISNHNNGDVYSRLGAHITMDQCFCLMSLDLVWRYHLNPSHHKIFVHFQRFGKKFHIKDIKRGQSFFEGAIAVTTNRDCGFDLFAEASGIAGYHSASYQALAGVQYSW
jgi:outer membrane autotransporter protein